MNTPLHQYPADNLEHNPSFESIIGCLETLPPSVIDREVHRIAVRYTEEVRERRRADIFNIHKQKLDEEWEKEKKRSICRISTRDISGESN
jgi:hypothetical protein